VWVSSGEIPRAIGSRTRSDDRGKTGDEHDEQEPVKNVIRHCLRPDTDGNRERANQSSKKRETLRDKNDDPLRGA
jgi:hypothetical protein